MSDRYSLADKSTRRNPAVTATASQCFTAITQALEAETLQGATAHRVAVAGKQLVQTAGVDANQILSTLSPETQQTVRNYFQ